MVIDTANEIGGHAAVPHALLLKARRVSVPCQGPQWRVINEALQNHAPEVSFCLPMPAALTSSGEHRVQHSAYRPPNAVALPKNVLHFLLSFLLVSSMMAHILHAARAPIICPQQGRPESAFSQQFLVRLERLHAPSVAQLLHPQVLVVDEVAAKAEAAVLADAVRRGIMVVAGMHVDGLQALLQEATLRLFVGGVQSPTAGADGASAE